MPEDPVKYSRVEEAEKIIHQLCKKYPDELWTIIPGSVVVLGIENKTRTPSVKWMARIVTMRGIPREIIAMNKIPVRWAIELYWKDWNQWKQSLKEWVIFHELLHVPEEEGKSVQHDVQDFALIVDAVGWNWNSKDDLPELLGAKKVKFNKDLVPRTREATQEQK